MQSERAAGLAHRDMDRRLDEYLQAIEDPSNPAQVHEMVTNDSDAAVFIESRMQQRGHPGDVRIDPPGFGGSP